MAASLLLILALGTFAVNAQYKGLSTFNQNGLNDKGFSRQTRNADYIVQDRRRGLIVNKNKKGLSRQTRSIKDRLFNPHQTHLTEQFVKEISRQARNVKESLLSRPGGGLGLSRNVRSLHDILCPPSIALKDEELKVIARCKRSVHNKPAQKGLLRQTRHAQQSASGSQTENVDRRGLVFRHVRNVNGGRGLVSTDQQALKISAWPPGHLRWGLKSLLRKRRCPHCK